MKDREVVSKIYKNAWFSRFCRREHITGDVLKDAIERLENGLIDANLGGCVYKQRISRSKGGKSGGYRAIVLMKKGDKAFFVYGFAKKDKENIGKEELREFRLLAQELLALSSEQLNMLVENGALTEVTEYEQ